MAENTRMAEVNNILTLPGSCESMEESPKEIEELLEELDNRLKELLESQQKMLEYMKGKERAIEETSPAKDESAVYTSPAEGQLQNSQKTLETLPQGFGPVLPRLEFPDFDGSNPQAWLCQANHYFENYPEDEFAKVRHASYYLTGVADLWYIENLEGKQPVNWDYFSNILLEQFSVIDIPVLKNVAIEQSEDVDTVVEELIEETKGVNDKESGSGEIDDKELVPQFNFQNGRLPPNELKERCFFTTNQFFQMNEFKPVTKEICKPSSFFSDGLFRKIDVECTGIVTRDAFVDYWISENILTKDTTSHIYSILKQSDHKYLTQDDFKHVLREILAYADAKSDSGVSAVNSVETDNNKRRVVVLRTGWVSTSFLKHLKNSSYDVQVISPRNYFAFTPWLPIVTCGTVEARSIVEPIRNLVRKKMVDAHYWEAECFNINPVNKKAHCCSKLTSIPDEKEKIFMEYHYLVIGIGAHVNTFNIHGVAENCHSLKEIEDAKKIRRTVVDCFERANPPNMRHCLTAVGEVAEFANIRKQLEVLEDRLDSMVQPRLTDALNTRKVNVVQERRGILVRIGRSKSIESYYTKIHLKPIKKLWDDFDLKQQYNKLSNEKNEAEKVSSSIDSQSNTPMISFSSWLMGFYDQLLFYLEQEWKWCILAFPEDYKTRVPKLLVETMLAIGSSFVSRVNLATADVVPETKALAKGILDILSGDLPKDVKLQNKHLGALIELHNLIGSFARNIQHLFSESEELQSLMAIDPDTKQLLYYEDRADNLKGTVSIDKKLLVDNSSIYLHQDKQDRYIDIGFPEVLSFSTDNFDYPNLCRPFVKGLLPDDIDIMGYKIFTHEINSSYVARVDNCRCYDIITHIIQMWTYPFVLDVQFAGNCVNQLVRQGMYRASDVELSGSAQIGPFSVIGSGTKIGSYSEESNSVIGEGGIIGSNVSIDGCYIWDPGGSHMGEVVDHFMSIFPSFTGLRTSLFCEGCIVTNGYEDTH